MRRLGPSVTVLVLCAAAGLGCGPTTPSQVIVIFEADAEVMARAARLRIDVFNVERQRQAWDINLVAGTPGAASFPIRLPLVPRSGDASRTFEVVGEVLDADEGVVARQRAISGYVEDELREVTLRFAADCADVLCGFRTTCVGGSCVDACTDPQRAGRGSSSFRTCDQGGVDGGVSDAAPADAAPADPTGCDDIHAGRLFCDGFEEDVAARWERIRQTNGTITRVESPLFRGGTSLEAQSTDGAAFVYVATDALDGITGDVWVRFYAYVPAGQEIVRFNLLYLGEGEAPFGGAEFGLKDGGRVFARPQPDDNTIETAMPVFPFDEWVCLELHVVLDPMAGMVEYFMNGTSLNAVSMVDTFPDTGFETINAGLGLTVMEQPPVAVYIDEIVADAMPIGCDP